jgi:hypothetical protein
MNTNEQKKILVEFVSKSPNNELIQSSCDNSKNLTTRIVFYSPRKFFPYKLVRYLKVNFYPPSTSSYRDSTV